MKFVGASRAYIQKLSKKPPAKSLSAVPSSFMKARKFSESSGEISDDDSRGLGGAFAVVFLRSADLRLNGAREIVRSIIERCGALIFGVSFVSGHEIPPS
jgi:hypothetical protein